MTAPAIRVRIGFTYIVGPKRPATGRRWQSAPMPN